MSERIKLLSLFPLDAVYLAALGEMFEIVFAPAADVRAVLTTGARGLNAEEMRAMPVLAFVGAFGAGYETIDVAYARSRGIMVTHGPGTNEDSVADHALALLLTVVRQIPMLDRACRAGIWRDDLPLPPQLAGKRVGILGMGKIGAKIARRCLGFDVSVGYHNRRRRADVDFQYFDGLVGLAAWCDVLVIVAPGNAGTRHLVDEAVLGALGPAGFLVNVGRGSVVDTQALARALTAGTLAGAGIDVYEGEPDFPEVLRDCPNLVVTPHEAGSSPEAMWAGTRLFMANARRFFAGEAVMTAVP